MEDRVNGRPARKRPVQLDGPGSERGVDGALSGGHPHTCVPAAAREAVVQVRMEEEWGAHAEEKGISSHRTSQPSMFETGTKSAEFEKRLHFRSIVNNFTYCGRTPRSASQPFIVFGSGGLK